MTEQQHPITPPEELIREWIVEAATASMADQHYIATQAARWGFRQCIKVDTAWLEDKLQKARDQELEACCSWADATGWYGAGDMLRAARRPKPPSLAEEALTALDQADEGLSESEWQQRSDTIRRALERLQELEKAVTELSPAAQAVLDAVCDNTEPDCDTQHLIAAALRAAADQVVPLHICGTNATRAQTRLGIRHKLLALATELENHQ